MHIGDVMTRQVRTMRVEESTDLSTAVLHFWSYRHLPVLDAEGHVVGMLTPTDLLEAAPRLGESRRIVVSEVMRRPVVTIQEDAQLETAVPQMRRVGVHALPVVDPAGRLVGIVTDVDVLVALAGERPRGID